MKLHISSKVKKYFKSATSLIPFEFDWFEDQKAPMVSIAVAKDESLKKALWVGFQYISHSEKQDHQRPLLNESKKSTPRLFFSTIDFESVTIPMAENKSQNSKTIAVADDDEMVWKILWQAAMDYYFIFKIFPSLRELESYLRDPNNHPVITSLEDFKTLIQTYQQWEMAFSSQNIQELIKQCPFKPMIKHKLQQANLLNGLFSEQNSLRYWRQWSEVVNLVLSRDGDEIKLVDWAPHFLSVMVEGNCKRCSRRPSLYLLDSLAFLVKGPEDPKRESSSNQSGSSLEPFNMFWLT